MNFTRISIKLFSTSFAFSSFVLVFLLSVTLSLSISLSLSHSFPLFFSSLALSFLAPSPFSLSLPANLLHRLPHSTLLILRHFTLLFRFRNLCHSRSSLFLWAIFLYNIQEVFISCELIAILLSRPASRPWILLHCQKKKIRRSFFLVFFFLFQLCHCFSENRISIA